MIAHKNRNKDVYTLLLKDTNLYLVDHKSKVAMKVAANKFTSKSIFGVNDF